MTLERSGHAYSSTNTIRDDRGPPGRRVSHGVSPHILGGSGRQVVGGRRQGPRTREESRREPSGFSWRTAVGGSARARGTGAARPAAAVVRPDGLSGSRARALVFPRLLGPGDALPRHAWL